jgi:release factor glutamine methyltransferase
LSDLQQLLSEVKTHLSSLSDTAALDAQVLLAHVLNRTRAWVLAHPQATISPHDRAFLDACIARLQSGEPLPYVLGRWEFYNLEFILNSETLIPRPETELLVDQALAWLKSNPKRRWALDIGSGSGCIAVSLAVNEPDLCILALDISHPALKIASANAAKHSVGKRVWPLQADLMPPVNAKFDLLCANLPYIPSGKLRKLTVARREPVLALNGGYDGLALIGRLLAFLPELLAPGGLALLEIEAGQGEAAYQIAADACPKADIGVLPDLAGFDRLLRIQL